MCTVSSNLVKIMQHDQVGIIPVIQEWIDIWKPNNVIHYNNRMKNKIPQSSQRRKKKIDRIQHPFMIKQN